MISGTTTCHPNLSPLHSYLCWFEEQKLLRSGPYKKALQNCVAYFAPLPHYNADIRLANIYIKSVSTKDLFTKHSTYSMCSYLNIKSPQL